MGSRGSAQSTGRQGTAPNPQSGLPVPATTGTAASSGPKAISEFKPKTTEVGGQQIAIKRLGNTYVVDINGGGGVALPSSQRALAEKAHSDFVSAYKDNLSANGGFKPGKDYDTLDAAIAKVKKKYQ